MTPLITKNALEKARSGKLQEVTFSDKLRDTYLEIMRVAAIPDIGVVHHIYPELRLVQWATAINEAANEIQEADVKYRRDLEKFTRRVRELEKYVASIAPR